MNDQDKKAQDLMEFLKNGSGSPMEGLVPTPPQPIEDYDAMLEQDQMPPEAIIDVPTAPVAPAIPDKTSQLKQVLSSLSSKSTAPAATPTPDYRDDILAQLQAARTENKENLDTARATDSKVGLMSDMNKAFNQIGTGIANQAGYTKITSNPLEVASQLAKQAETDNAGKLAGISEKYKIQSEKEKSAEEKAQQKLDNSFKQQMLDLQRIKATQDKKEAEGAGQKELDKQVAKEYQEWSSGGQKVAQSEIGKLKNVIQDLRSEKVTTGGLTGMFPDQLTSNKILGARADVQSSVMGSLRQLLGAQFTEKEGERVIKNTWNEADSTENNIDRLERLANDLESKAIDKSNKARYFQQNNATMKGYKQSADETEAPKTEKTITGKQYSPSRNQTRVQYSDGTTEVLDGKQ